MSSQPQTSALDVLVPAKARRALLESLFSGDQNGLTVSELARRAKLTPRAVSLEVKKLESAGLVSVEAVGGAHAVSLVGDHPMTKALSNLVRASRAPAPAEKVDATMVRESLAAYGAPLPEKPVASLGLPEALLRGLELARHNATVFRTLPTVVAAHEKDMNWIALKELAHRMMLEPELGMLLDLTAEVSGRASLREHAAELRDGRRKRQTFFPEITSKYEMELARRRTPPCVARWGFSMNMTEDAFRSTLVKHGPV